MSFFQTGYIEPGYFPAEYFEGSSDAPEPGTVVYGGVPFTRVLEIFEGDDYTGSRALIVTEELREAWPDLTGETVWLTARHKVTGAYLASVATVTVATGDAKTITVEIAADDNVYPGVYGYNLETMETTLRAGTLRIRPQIAREAP